MRSRISHQGNGRRNVLGLLAAIVLVFVLSALSGSDSEDLGVQREAPHLLRRRQSEALSCFRCSHTSAAMSTYSEEECTLLPTEKVGGSFYPKTPGPSQCYSDPERHPWQAWVFTGESVWEAAKRVDDANARLPSTPPPTREDLSAQQIKMFTMGGAALMSDFYRNDVVNDTVTQWPSLEPWTRNRNENKNYGTYDGDSKNFYDAVGKYFKFVRGLRGAVFGSRDPWVEEILIRGHGAEHVTTVEHGIINTSITEVSTLTMLEFEEIAIDGSLPLFEFAASFSSLEHAGLGRYGDPLNPVGDLQTLAKISCTLKPGGLLFLGVLIKERDELAWNAHRIYGHERLKFVVENFRLIDVVGEDLSRPTMVFQNMRGCTNAW